MCLLHCLGRGFSFYPNIFALWLLIQPSLHTHDAKASNPPQRTKIQFHAVTVNINCLSDYVYIAVTIFVLSFFDYKSSTTDML